MEYCVRDRKDKSKFQAEKKVVSLKVVWNWEGAEEDMKSIFSVKDQKFIVIQWKGIFTLSWKSQGSWEFETWGELNKNARQNVIV